MRSYSGSCLPNATPGNLRAAACGTCANQISLEAGKVLCAAVTSHLQSCSSLSSFNVQFPQCLLDVLFARTLCLSHRCCHWVSMDISTPSAASCPSTGPYRIKRCCNATLLSRFRLFSAMLCIFLALFFIFRSVLSPHLFARRCCLQSPP